MTSHLVPACYLTGLPFCATVDHLTFSSKSSRNRIVTYSCIVTPKHKSLFWIRVRRIVSLCAVIFPPCPYSRLQGSEANSMGRKHRGGAKKKALPSNSCPDCTNPRVWCVTHLFEGGEPEDVDADPSEGAPGFHAHLMVLGYPKSPLQEKEGEEVSSELLEHQQPASEGPMMDNFDTFLEHYGTSLRTSRSRWGLSFCSVVPAIRTTPWEDSSCP